MFKGFRVSGFRVQLVGRLGVLEVRHGSRFSGSQFESPSSEGARPSRNGWVDKDLTDFTATAGIVLRSGEPGATKFANGFEAAPHVKP